MSAAESPGKSAASRRDALKLAVFGAAALSLPVTRWVNAASVRVARLPTSRIPRPFTLAFRPSSVATPVMTKIDPVTGDHVDLYDIEMRRVNLDILGNGMLTPTFAYGGRVPGPTIRTSRGRRTVVRQLNDLPAVHPTLRYKPWTSVHLHGSASLPQYDGYASDITDPGSYKRYRYPNHQQGRTLWYHDHGVHHTAENAYSGLAAQYHILDGSETELALPQGPYDVALTVHDLAFASDGSLFFSLDNESGMWGDVVCVNGTPWPLMGVEPRKYRFRILVASVSRSYRFSLSGRIPVWMVSGDGGMHPFAQKVTSWRHSMGERYDIVIDFAPYAGRTIDLLNATPDNNVDFPNTDKVMRFAVGRTVTSSAGNMPYLDTTQSRNVAADVHSTQIPLGRALPSDRFPGATQTMDLVETQAVNYGAAPRRFKLDRRHSEWAINGNSWKTVEKSNFTHVEATPRVGTIEVWEAENSSGGWHHPFHIHLADFKILSRNGKAPFNYEASAKDVVFLGENETVRMLVKFETLGRYMVHCHNVVHEDHDMMSQFAVLRDPTLPVDHPVNNTMYWDDEFATPYRASWWRDVGQISLDPRRSDPSTPRVTPLPPLDL